MAYCRVIYVLMISFALHGCVYCKHDDSVSFSRTVGDLQINVCYRKSGSLHLNLSSEREFSLEKLYLAFSELREAVPPCEASGMPKIYVSETLGSIISSCCCAGSRKNYSKRTETVYDNLSFSRRICEITNIIIDASFELEYPLGKSEKISLSFTPENGNSK